MKNLGIVTARKNSKRLPNKNKLKLGNKALIRWTIDEAIRAKCIDYVAVISDDPEIHRIIEYVYGIQDPAMSILLPVVEPPELGDDGRHIDAIIYGIHEVIDRMLHIKEPVDLEDLRIILTQSTSPFRTAQDIDHFYNIFKYNTSRPIASVDPFWKPCGAIYMIQYRDLMNMRSFHGPKTRYVPLEYWNAWDIDYQEQFNEAKKHVEEMKYDP